MRVTAGPLSVDVADLPAALHLAIMLRKRGYQATIGPIWSRSLVVCVDQK